MPVIPIDSPESCVLVLIQYCKTLAIQNMALRELLLRDVPDWQAQLGRACVESQRTVGPGFHRLAEIAESGNWLLLHKTLETEISKLKELEQAQED